MASVAVERILQKLDGVKPGAGGWVARCPAHDDKVQSLKIDERSDGSVLLHCHAGCSKTDLLAALDLKFSDLFAPKDDAGPIKKTIVKEYNYRSLTGEVLYQCVRYYPKEFRQRRPDPTAKGGWAWNLFPFKNKRVPYRLPELKGQNLVAIVEGEKDADRLWSIGIPATTNIGGATNWTANDSKSLKAAGVSQIVVIPDNDEAGLARIEAVIKSVAQQQIVTGVVALPGVGPHEDVSDWLSNGGSKEQLLALMMDALNGHSSYTPIVDEPEPDLHAQIITAPNALSDPMKYNLTHAGAADAFCDRFGHLVRFDHTRGKWFIWDQHRWRIDEDEAVNRLALEHVRQWTHEVVEAAAFADRKKWQDFTLRLEQRPQMQAMTWFARTNVKVKVSGLPWDTDPWLLCVKNGVLDLRTGTLRDGRPSDLITLQAGAAYDPDALCHRWVQFLGEVFDDGEVIEFVQQFAGYCLTGRTSEQIVLFCYGKGRNGKGRLWTALRSVMGEYAAVLPFSSLIASRKGGEASNDLAAIQGKRLVTASEINEGARLNEARIKSLTGEDPITARFLYAEFGTFDPAAKFVLAVNHKPVVRDDSEGFWRRVRLIDFRNQFTGTAADPDLDNKLKAELPGILAWAVQGCLDWQHGGKLSEPASMVAAAKEYEQDSDPLEDFLMTECEDRDQTPAAAHETGNAMFSAYLEWCESTRRSKEDRLSSTAFGLALSKKFKKTRDTGRVLYFGIRLKPRKSSLLSEPDGPF